MDRIGRREVPGRDGPRGGRLDTGACRGLLSERYRESRPLIDEAAVSAGRHPGEIRTVFNLPGRITDRPLAATRDREGRWIGGSAGQWAEELAGAVLEHGAGGSTLFPGGDGAHSDVSLGRWAREIVPAVREAVGKEKAAR